MEYLRDIESYGEEVADFEVSPFESVDMLHLRSRLHKHSHEMTLKERILLIRYDLRLLENVEKMLRHIGEIYDFSHSEEPLE